jgi:hypothetical protein
MLAKLKSTLTDNQKNLLESIFIRQTGYVLQDSDQFNKVGLNNLTILPFETINLKSFEQEDKFFKKIMYSATSKKQDWDYNSLKYNKKTNSIIRWSVPMDFGEWIYTNNTVHIELRAVVPILQLLKPYDKKPFSNNIRESLCGDVTLLLDTLSNEMQNDFPDKNQIKLLKAQTKEEYKIYEEFKKQNVKESEEQKVKKSEEEKVNQSEEQTVSLPDEYGSESDLEYDSDFEYESESDD